MSELSRSASRIAEELARLGVDAQVVELPDSTRTALEAAQAIGCEVGQIVKSLVFRMPAEDRPVLVLASGADRVDEDRLAALLGGEVEQASGRFVRERTGFAIGGVPPFGHDERLVTYLDEHLLSFEVVWAAGGTPRAVFPIAPAELVRASDATVVSVAVR